MTRSRYCGPWVLGVLWPKRTWNLPFAWCPSTLKTGTFWGIYWQSQYYIDLYLPFGLRSAPFLFNQISDALEWILKHNYGLRHVIHILDDFFIAEKTKFACLGSFTTLLKVFMSLRVPTVASKTLGRSQVLEFMGIVLDSNRHGSAIAWG